MPTHGILYLVLYCEFSPGLTHLFNEFSSYAMVILVKFFMGFKQLYLWPQPESPSSFSRAVGHWTNSLYQYFEREQARLEGLAEPPKKSKIVETLAAARERARKMSATVAGGSVREPPANFHMMPAAAASGGGPGIGSSMAVWGGGRRASTAATGAPRRASHSVAVTGGVRRASHASGAVGGMHVNNNNNNAVGALRQMKRADTSSQM